MFLAKGIIYSKLEFMFLSSSLKFSFTYYKYKLTYAVLYKDLLDSSKASSSV